MDRVIVRLGGNAIDVGRPFTSAAIQSRHLSSHLPRCQYTNSAFVVNCAITLVPGLLLVTCYLLQPKFIFCICDRRR